MAIDSRYKLKTGEEVDYFPPIQNTDNPYLTEAAMHADQSNQLEGYGYLVDGVGAFTYLGTLAGSSADYEAFGGASAIPKEHEINGIRVNASVPLAGNIVATPVNAAFTAGTGTLAAATYYYRVSAINAYGETIPSVETSFAAAATTGVNVNWGAVTGATGYKIYGRSTDAELLIATVGAVTTYLDDGSVTPVGAMPTTDTTGFHFIDWNVASAFVLTMTNNTTFVSSNLPTGVNSKIINAIITGAFVPTFPSTWTLKPATDVYDGAKLNQYTINCINGTAASEMIYYHNELLN